MEEEDDGAEYMNARFFADIWTKKVKVRYEAKPCKTSKTDNFLAKCIERIMEHITPEEAVRQYTLWKAKQKEAQRKYRETHKEAIAERRRNYYTAHVEEVRERNREYMRNVRQKTKDEKENQAVE